MSDSGQIEVKIRKEDDAVVVQPIGEIDLSCSVALRHQLREVQSARPNRLVIDLRDVPYMDSSGVATLVESLQVARRDRTTLVLCSLQERVKSVFEIARLDMVFTIAENADKALSV
jgi:anti-sigma B factor antagonist